MNYDIDGETLSYRGSYKNTGPTNSINVKRKVLLLQNRIRPMTLPIKSFSEKEKNKVKKN